MSYCLNPNCPKPNDPLNAHNLICRHCGSSLVLQNRYRVKHLLGEGGFGKTFEIADEQDNRLVLKILTDTNPKAISLFKREAQVLSRLEHPGIPRVETDGYFTYTPRDSKEPLHCLVMEKIEGSNLEDWLAKRNYQPISESQARIWLKQLVEILHQVHQQQYFHRDIKPSNIMLRQDGQLVLIDFGSVRELTSTYFVKAEEGVQRGTGIISPGYTPPEQANGKAVPQSDFFALGRTFVFLLTGKNPNDFPEDPRTGELIWRQMAIDVSPALSGLIDRMMAPFPGNRPQNTQEILQRLADMERFVPLSGQSTIPVRSITYNTYNRPYLQSRGVILPTTSFSKGKRRHRSTKTPTLNLRGFVKVNNNIVAGIVVLLSIAIISLLLTQVTFEIYQDLLPGLNASTARKVPKSSSLSRYNGKKVVFKNLGNHTQGVNALALSRNGEWLATASTDKTIKVWNLQSGKQLYILQGHNKEVWALASSPDGNRLASGGGDNTIKIWDLGSGTLLNTLEAHEGRVLAIAFSADGKLLASGSSDKTVRLWEANTGKAIASLRGHLGWVNAVAFHPKLPLLASASEDGTVNLWDLRSGKLLLSLNGYSLEVKSIAFTPDGQILASGNGDGSINLWDMQTGERMQPLFAHSAPVESLVFSPDGQTLVSGGGTLDHTIKIWDWKTGQLLQVLKGHSDLVRSLAIAPDGTTIYSGSEDNSIGIWQVHSSEF
ncbi:MAG: serine/threonine protein kinase [Oscillatoriaceae bacterium SKW80]|nr:serine/threonine protein kinase [Oscillatoriaceae bacterium SKYG93]MCX8121066.1 serine/threonine protein kinase [Oscillatoriaceae bacterium SKW80]MDW8453604.1 serine/threonine-protein kinase [Oscillatoriaceae cyanobacterium SKYGB_i_bin93]